MSVICACRGRWHPLPLSQMKNQRGRRSVPAFVDPGPLLAQCNHLITLQKRGHISDIEWLIAANTVLREANAKFGPPTQLAELDKNLSSVRSSLEGRRFEVASVFRHIFDERILKDRRISNYLQEASQIIPKVALTLRSECLPDSIEVCYILSHIKLYLQAIEPKRGMKLKHSEKLTQEDWQESERRLSLERERQSDVTVRAHADEFRSAFSNKDPQPRSQFRRFRN